MYKCTNSLVSDCIPLAFVDSCVYPLVLHSGIAWKAELEMGYVIVPEYEIQNRTEILFRRNVYSF